MIQKTPVCEEANVPSRTVEPLRKEEEGTSSEVNYGKFEWGFEEALQEALT
jgi:hypothetical protein